MILNFLTTDQIGIRNRGGYMLRIKEKIVGVLIVCGIISFIIYILITKIIINIPTKNNIAGLIGVFTLLPIFIGLFIYSEKIKNKRNSLSRIIKFISIIYILAFIASCFFTLI